MSFRIESSGSIKDGDKKSRNFKGTVELIYRLACPIHNSILMHRTNSGSCHFQARQTTISSILLIRVKLWIGHAPLYIEGHMKFNRPLISEWFVYMYFHFQLWHNAFLIFMFKFCIILINYKTPSINYINHIYTSLLYKKYIK